MGWPHKNWRVVYNLNYTPICLFKMVDWKELENLLKSSNGAALKPINLQTSPSEIAHFPILERVAAAPAQAPVIRNTITYSEVPPTPVVPATPAPRPSTPPLKPVAEKRAVEAPTPSKQTIDPIVLGIEETEPLYVGAPYATRHMIEIEAAQKVEAQLDTLYKSCSGRSRGWTKVGLEAMIKPRCASGGDLKEIDRAKKAFHWSLAHDDKGMSAFLDFVCCARRIRCIIMNSETKTAYLYPAADIHDEDTKDKAYPMYCVDTKGHIMFGLKTAKELLAFVDKERWSLMPPASVTHTLSGLKLEELESVGKRLGMTEVGGKKTERIAAIAGFKTRKRLVDS
jgi:hypothetical protein